jgi:hypothetical protein
MPLRSKATPLSVREAEAPGELLAEDSVLLDEVLDRVLLLAVDPAREREEQKA